jgi:hypothetical protein
MWNPALGVEIIADFPQDFPSLIFKTWFVLNMMNNRSAPNVMVELFIFWRCRVQISAWSPAVVTDLSHGFRQSLQANAEIVPLN